LKKKITWNFFDEYQGKNIVDGHFGLLSRWFSEIEKTKKISTIDDLIHLYEEKIEITNKEQSNETKLDIQFFYYRRTNRPAFINYLKINNFSTFFCFMFNQGRLTAYPSATKENGIDIPIKVCQKEDKRKTKLPPAKIIQDKTYGEKRHHSRVKTTQSIFDLPILCNIFNELNFGEVRE